ncbi:putative metaldependent phosphohydrolase [Gottschalkia acidurici 9a]|uniref:Metaldependent phosphohydrolase n=1 Tax=Gottschalkia acidurici (strain ATCC 7906 / DSM 604 / BCRC 14475 / CIP 104303 / KCTC 5404 / NCIMB 10678 / 9a) TaxID=1128398 RepID=K0B2F6_GOTA9|nr:HD domain-containing protein [Gottschalkia acidurici]AFS78806.1 putative metaldependent phosphohydrolase [Gottschalkia acidurici 9a]
MGFGNYLKIVRKLNNMGRWSNEYMHMRATVSEHLFFVTQIGQMLAVIEEENGNTIDWKKLLTKLINHDVPEAMTGDIINTMKYRDSKLKALVDKIEDELVEEVLIEELENPYKEKYREILTNFKDDTIEGQILSYADSIDALLECIYEIQLGNTQTFNEKYSMLVNKLKESNLISVKYFIDEILPSIVEDIEILQ